MATTSGYGYGMGFGGYLNAYTTSVSTYGQRQQPDYLIDSMRYAVHWDVNKLESIQNSDHYGREGEAKTILQRLRRETRDFIGDRKLVLC